MIAPERAALLLIDMQRGFINPASSLCVAGAAATVPACARALAAARAWGVAVVHVRREYRADGTDVEPVRFDTWRRGGRPLSAAADDPASLDAPAELAPVPGESIVVKPRFSAFFGTRLHRELLAHGVDTVVLAGTTTPNCIRTTCYDALSLNYNVVVLEDATSSRTPEVQRANVADMAHVGAWVMGVDEFALQCLANVPDVVGDFNRAVAVPSLADPSRE